MFSNKNTVIFVSLILILTKPVSSRDSPDQNCFQWTVNEHCCKFPFVYNGKIYHSCTQDGTGSIIRKKYFWCMYDDHGSWSTCKGTIYQPTDKSTMESSTETKTSVLMTSSRMDIPAITQIPSASPLSTSSPNPEVAINKSSGSHTYLHATTMSEMRSPNSTKITAMSTVRKKAEKPSIKKNKIYITVIVTAIGGFALVIVLGISVAIYLKRKRKNREKRRREEEPQSLKDKDEADNHLYEEVEDSEVNKDNKKHKTDNTASAEHVYHELEQTQSPMEKADPPDADSSSPTNETNNFVHFNELYTSN